MYEFDTKSKIFQIYYNDETRGILDPAFIPLDNTENKRPDWFEFWVIRHFLKSNHLEQDTFYGFLSPNFIKKTGLNGADVKKIIREAPSNTDVILLSSFTHDLAIHKNPFLQGDIVQPGLLNASQHFFDRVGVNVNLKSMVTSISNSVFSNYIVAKSAFWFQWLKLADQFYDFVENDKFDKKYDLKALVPYANRSEQVKVFVQERLATIVLQNKFEIYIPEKIRSFQMYDFNSRNLLIYLDRLKNSYINTGNEHFIDEYEDIIKRIFAANIENVKSNIKRNSLCPCGSGKKYKHCHGAIR